MPCAPRPLQCDLKYIDPSYMIRASATITTDRIYCKVALLSCKQPWQPARCGVQWNGALWRPSAGGSMSTALVVVLGTERFNMIHDADIDSLLQVLGQGAVHGAFAGYTGFTVGLVNTHYVYLPIPGPPLDPDTLCPVAVRVRVHVVMKSRLCRQHPVPCQTSEGLRLLLAVVIQAPRTVDPKGRSYNRLITAINQPSLAAAADAVAAA